MQRDSTLSFENKYFVNELLAIVVGSRVLLRRLGRIMKAWSTQGVIIITVIANIGCGQHLAKSAEAPFGFAWSQNQAQLPPPSSTTVDANIIALEYEGTALPSQMTDTAAVILKVCEHHGLQQVRWVSRDYNFDAGVDKFLEIYEEGVKRYGEPNEGNKRQARVAWSGERIGMRMYRDEQSRYRILQILDGPLFEQCEAEHREITGHQ
jgi:hypothetical protein